MVLKTDGIGGKDKQTMKQNREPENRSSHLRKTDRKVLQISDYSQRGN